MDELLTDLRAARSYLKLAESNLERDNLRESLEWVQNALELNEQLIRQYELERTHLESIILG